MEPIVETKRDQRVLDWMASQVGHQAIADACVKLAGARRAFPSNLAKLLGLSPPKELALASPEDVEAHLRTIRQILGLC